MKYKALKTCSALFMLLSCHFANAALMATNVDLTITDVAGNHAAVDVGDVFQFTAIYDDMGTHFRINDSESICLDIHVITSSVTCTSEFLAENFGFFSDASLNFISMFDTSAMLAAGGTWFERTTANRSYGFSYRSTPEAARPNSLEFGMVNDKMRGRIDSTDEQGVVSFYYLDNQLRQESTSMSFLIGAFSTSPVDVPDVPEPSTFAYFAMGMMGLASRRFKK